MIADALDLDSLAACLSWIGGSVGGTEMLEVRHHLGCDFSADLEKVETLRVTMPISNTHLVAVL